MTTPVKQIALKDFRKIPGVGPKIAEYLWSMGYRSVAELKGRDPEEMYAALCDLQGRKVDICMLYVFQCALYFITEETHEPELLKWWNWKARPAAYKPEF